MKKLSSLVTPEKRFIGFRSPEVFPAVRLINIYAPGVYGNTATIQRSILRRNGVFCVRINNEFYELDNASGLVFPHGGAL